MRALITSLTFLAVSAGVRGGFLHQQSVSHSPATGHQSFSVPVSAGYSTGGFTPIVGHSVSSAAPAQTNVIYGSSVAQSPISSSFSAPISSGYPSTATVAVPSPVSIPAPAPAAAVPIAGHVIQAVSAGGSPNVHEIHSYSGKQRVRVEEIRAPQQLIRVHEGGQAPPEVIKVRAPAGPQNIIRLLTRGSGPAQIDHVVRQAPGVQVIDVHKQPAPGHRYIHIVREAGAPAKVEVQHEPQAGAQIVLQGSSAPNTVVLGPSGSSNSASFGAIEQSPGFGGFASAPAVSAPQSGVVSVSQSQSFAPVQSPSYGSSGRQVFKVDTQVIPVHSHAPVAHNVVHQSPVVHHSHSAPHIKIIKKHHHHH